MRTGRKVDPIGGGVTRRSWPYALATVALVFGAIKLLLAPFGGAVYLALPGVALATWYAYGDACPFRVAFALSLSAFLIGLATGLTGLYLAAAGSLSFATQESGFLLGALALWLLPVLGLLVGGVALVGAHFRPGVPDSTWRRDEIDPG